MRGLRRHGPRVRRPTAGEPVRTGAFAKELSDSPELHLSPNTISSSLWQIHLTPRVFPNFPTHTLGQPCPWWRGERRHWASTPATRGLRGPIERVGRHLRINATRWVAVRGLEAHQCELQRRATIHNGGAIVPTREEDGGGGKAVREHQ